MLTTTKGPGDEITWPTSFAGDVTICADDIQNVIAERTRLDPVGRNYEELMDLMAEESTLDTVEAEDAAVVYLTKHMDDPGFPPVLKASLTEAFTSIAEQTEIGRELLLHRHTANVED